MFIDWSHDGRLNRKVVWVPAGGGGRPGGCLGKPRPPLLENAVVDSG